jgi:Amidohydrolase family
VEHASVTPPEVVATLAELGIAVVTQPGFVATRGDDYLREVEAEDRPDLYRCASLRAAGLAVAGSTDAPFGPDDPWVAVRAAVERRTPGGIALGPEEAVDPVVALELFLAPLERPGGRPRRVAPWVPANLCLLDLPLHQVLADPSSRHVALTLFGGERTFSSG